MAESGGGETPRWRPCKGRT